LLDEGITKNIVRLGSRTRSEKVKDFNLEKVCKTRGFNRNLSYSIRQLNEKLEEIERKIVKVNRTFSNRWMKWDDIHEYLKSEEESFYKKFISDNDDLPSWVLGTTRYKLINDFLNLEDGYQIQGKRRSLSVFDKWIKGEDIVAINKRKIFLSNNGKNKDKDSSNQNKFAMLTEDDGKNKDNGSDQNKFAMLAEDDGKNKDEDSSNQNTFAVTEEIQWINNCSEPKTNRPLDVLLNDYSIWQMSRVERQKLHDYWRIKAYDKIVEQLSNLQEKHEEYRQEIDNIYDQGRREALLKSDVIGMTTSGAAKYQNLIRSIRPKIIICEEAGEVLEAHILSALTESTQHLILIGDHNQLRPHIATYSLSVDSLTGKEYQLDKSLFERLVCGDNAIKIEKTQLLTQRRMREKEISDLVRHTLYPNLIDGENTAKYPKVRGAQHNVYFIDHRRPEDDGGEFAIQSHVNKYEVEMVVEMVKYFVRNGYTNPGDIAVLTPYLGQMIKIKDALAKSFTVVIDERDAQNIAKMEEEQEQENEENKYDKYNRKGRKRNDNINICNINRNIRVASTKPLSKNVILRTVDNFQGEEANIVIVSLVRNFSKYGGHDSIGFLRSSNRSNVLLSRAREGMYLIGNSELMAAKSKNMWAPVINMLRTRNQVGFGMPIVCNQHPEYKNIIIEPEQFVRVSPDGGCYEKCNKQLPCGHPCTYKCHSDDPEHIGVKCPEPCKKQLPCGHPCTYKCHLDDPKHIRVRCPELCRKPLPCGHTCTNKCHPVDSKHIKVRCFKPCSKLLPQCNHPCSKRCFEDCGRCDFPVGNIKLPGCGHILENAKCWQKQIKETLKCTTLVTKEFPYCEHSNSVHVRKFFIHIW
jgi:hypothetical protein